MRRVPSKLAAQVLALMCVIVMLPELHAQAIDWNSPDLQQDMQSFQQFLANHPWIAGKLKENPSLANDAGFQRHSPELPQFLNAHPLLQSEFKIDANGVMTRAQQGDMTSPNNSGNDQEVQNFKHFLSIHPWTAAKLQENPALANDKGFVKGDKELFEFLNSNPYVQAQFRTDPNDFMKRVQALATQEPRPGASGPHASDYTELKVFLQNHAWIADRLKEDPSRAASKDFLNKSKELREFLETHPYLQDQFKQDPRRTLDQAMQSGQEYL